MSRKSSTVCLSATITLAVFVAVAAFIINPYRGNNNYSSQVLDEAKNRQTLSVASVPEPLETDIEARKSEDKMAEKVSAILKEDDDFVNTMGEKSANYVASQMPEIEEKYSQDMLDKIAEGKRANDSAIASLESDLNETKNSISSNEDIASYLLSDKAFVDGITETVASRVSNDVDAEELAKEIISSESFKNALNELLASNKDSIPLPQFNTESSAVYSEEEYLKKREEARNSEIGKILDFLGY